MTFCLNMACDAEAVRLLRERVEPPYDAITEVMTVTPGNTFFRCSPA
jgi:hypothetical protein